MQLLIPVSDLQCFFAAGNNKQSEPKTLHYKNAKNALLFYSVYPPAHKGIIIIKKIYFNFQECLDFVNWPV